MATGVEPAKAGATASPRMVLVFVAVELPVVDATPDTTVTSWPSVEDEGAAGLATGLVAELAGGGGAANADVTVVTTVGQT